MNKSSLPALEELLIESVDPRGYRVKVGIPHPLMKFGLNGQFKDDCYADAIVSFIVDTTLESGTDRYRTAVWFLLESEHAYYEICSKAGIDAERLRQHLCRQIPCDASM